VAVARALVKEPELLLLDEPLSNLDAALRLTMRTEIKSLQQKLGVTTLLVTHDQVEAMTMADRIICMREGRIEQVGKPSELYTKPQSKFIASFIGAPPINLVEGTVRSNQFVHNGLRFACRSDFQGEAILGIRPEHLRLSDSGIDGTILQIEPLGREHLYIVETGLGLLTVLETGTLPRYAAKAQIKINFAEDHTLLFDAQTEMLLGGAHVTV
jgi:inositol-phosphate transport system ATP-binding protein